MPLHVAATDYRLGELLGEAALREDAGARLDALGVRAPTRFVDMLLPKVRA
jgi:hypothetical protein